MSSIVNPGLPPLYFVKSRNYTYARTYKAKWQDKKDKSKKQSVKTCTATVGRIDSSLGVGEISFYEEFVRKYPILKGLKAVRCTDDTSKSGYKVVYTALSDEPLNNASAPLVSHKSVGAVLVLEKLIKEDPAGRALQTAMPKLCDDILSFAYYLVINPDGALGQFAAFARNTKLPGMENAAPEDIKSLFKSIREDDVLEFFTWYHLYLIQDGMFNAGRFWVTDSTCTITYEKLFNASCKSSGQQEIPPALNLLMVTEENTGRPLFYQMNQGFLPDISKCISAFEKISHIKDHSFIIVADKGFFSRDNTKIISSSGHGFIMCVSSDKASSYQTYVNEALNEITHGDNYYNRRHRVNMYTCREMLETEDMIKAWVHVYYDELLKEEQLQEYQIRLNEAEKAYLSGCKLTVDNLSFLSLSFINQDGEYQKDPAGRLILDKEHYQKTVGNFGVFLVISDVIDDSVTAYEALIGRCRLEQTFASLKARMKPAGIHVSTESSLAGKCFVQFLALTMRSLIADLMIKAESEGRNIPNADIFEMLSELQAVTEYYLPRNHGYIVNKPSKLQLQCFELFGVKPPVSRYDTGSAVLERGS